MNKTFNPSRVIKIVIVIFIIFGVSLTLFGKIMDYYNKENWQGFYYPNGCLSCEENWILSPILDDYESCRDWALTITNERNNENDLWECGKNCKMNNDGITICKETRQ